MAAIKKIKTSLKIQKGNTESINRRTGNTVTRRKNDKRTNNYLQTLL